jgi:uncharacterized alpha-E superfamily protein
MSHGEGWRFVQLGKFTERACAISMMLDAYFSIPTKADDLDWVTLLAAARRSSRTAGCSRPTSSPIDRQVPVGAP